MKNNRSFLIALLLTVVVTALYRVMPNRPYGFAPQIAVALFSGALFVKNKKWAFVMPLLSMFISDLLYEVLYLNGLSEIKGFYGGQWVNYLLFAGLTLFGFLIRPDKASNVLGAALAAPTTYFLVSNTIVWAGNGGYHRPKTFEGLMTCLADGLPFYKMGIIATVVFSCILFGSYYLLTVNNTKTAKVAA